jgi:DNA-directed RNA polymerase specialized sigma24 family protein
LAKLVQYTQQEHRGTMGQEISVSYQAVKSKVYRLIDSLVENDKSEDDVQESVKRWWKHIHPADRPIARKHLLSVLSKSNATLAAMADALSDLQDFEIHAVRAETVSRLHTMPAPTPERMKASV